MPLRNVATNYTFEQQRQEINLIATDLDALDTNKVTNARLAISVNDAGGEGSLAYDSGTGVITYTGPAALPQSLGQDASPTFANLTVTGYIAGPATLTIDPAAVGDNTGTVVIAGNLQVDGVTTTVNSTTMTVDDLAITVASGAANAAAADAAGIDVDGAGATFYYRSAPDAWASNKKLLVNQTSEQASRANLEVTSTKDASFPQYSYGIMATDDAAYNVNPGSGIGFGYKWNASGNYAQAGGIRMIKENTNDNDYAGAMLFYTRPMGDGPLERLRITSDGKVRVPDNGMFTAGAGDDLQIYHSGTNNFINSTGSADLYLRGANFLFQDQVNSNRNWLVGLANGTLEMYHAGSKKLETTSTGVTVTGTISDSMGPLRSLGVSTKSSAYQLGLGDVGRMIVQTGNSQSVTIPNGFSAGDMITIINQTATNINLVQGTGLTLYNTADASTGTRTLAQRGASTVVFTDSNTAYISGSGLT